MNGSAHAWRRFDLLSWGSKPTLVQSTWTQLDNIIEFFVEAIATWFEHFLHKEVKTKEVTTVLVLDEGV